jgi:hypothetical protein
MQINGLDELIAMLNRIRMEHGNLPTYVLIHETDTESNLDVEIREASSQINFSGDKEELPRRVLFS